MAGIAAYISYWHAYAVVREYGESGVTAQLEPATIDGLVYASSMVTLHAARHRLPVPRLARWMLALGILASLAVNVAQGWSHGLVGAVVAPWPAASLVGSYELSPRFFRCCATWRWGALRTAFATHGRERGARCPSCSAAWPTRICNTCNILLGDGGKLMIIRGGQEAAKVPAVVAASDAVPRIDPLHARAAQEFAAEVAAGRKPCIRAIRARLHVGQPRAQQVQAHLGALIEVGEEKETEPG